ncbi:hypothetical protein [uncultured Desulfuromusa sp.]|uniref:hypothetical protein n=1 Tax=uncultured Desulfuromusa sp. TaxID=219183 RepID=UPI002AA81B2D|nr:hypothetical protein [uncultured Desulfuromusa sp.]
MKHLTVGHLPYLNLTELGGTYVSTFGIIWLIIEPLSLFGLMPESISTTGWLGYIALIILSLVIATPISQKIRKIKFNRQELLKVNVESSLEGVTYSVKTPANIQVYDFSRLFVDHLERGPVSKKIKALKWHYSPVLNIRRGETKVELDNSMTLQEANIKEHDVLFITGKQIEPMTPRFSIRAN